ncbi:MAG: PepSY domain-containing protein [Haliea sp.]|nr:PepSY domain-containing protein [Haliea sp.]
MVGSGGRPRIAVDGDRPVHVVPRRRQAAPAQESSRRGIWRRWHLLTGLYSAVLLCFFLLSGLAWTNIWGGKFVQAWSSFPAEKWGPLSLSGVNHAAMNHGVAKEVPWGLEQTPLPASTRSASCDRGMAPCGHALW